MTKEQIQEIFNHYELGEVLSFSKIEKGFISHNYRVETSRGILFLKQHDPNKAWQIDSIEKAESFLATNDIPVIEPLITKEGTRHIFLNELCYAIYPFVSGISYVRGDMPERALSSMGEMLARIHLLTKDGVKDTYSEYSYYKFGIKEKVLEQINQCLNVISKIEEKTSFDIFAKETLEFKKNFIEQCDLTFDSFDVHDRHICYGDYQTDNVFFDEEGKVLHLFDVDMAGPGPRLFDLIRSSMLSCFDNIYTPQRFVQAKTFIHSYYRTYPFGEKQFRDAVEVYYLKQIWSVWMETTHYLKNTNRVDVLYKPNMDTIKYLENHRQELCDELLKGL